MTILESQGTAVPQRVSSVKSRCNEVRQVSEHARVSSTVTESNCVRPPPSELRKGLQHRGSLKEETGDQSVHIDDIPSHTDDAIIANAAVSKSTQDSSNLPENADRINKVDAMAEGKSSADNEKNSRVGAQRDINVDAEPSESLDVVNSSTPEHLSDNETWKLVKSKKTKKASRLAAREARDLTPVECAGALRWREAKAREARWRQRRPLPWRKVSQAPSSTLDRGTGQRKQLFGSRRHRSPRTLPLPSITSRGSRVPAVRGSCFKQKSSDFLDGQESSALSEHLSTVPHGGRHWEKQPPGSSVGGNQLAIAPSEPAENLREVPEISGKDRDCAQVEETHKLVSYDNKSQTQRAHSDGGTQSSSSSQTIPPAIIAKVDEGPAAKPHLTSELAGESHVKKGNEGEPKEATSEAVQRLLRGRLEERAGAATRDLDPLTPGQASQQSASPAAPASPTQCGCVEEAAPDSQEQHTAQPAQTVLDTELSPPGPQQSRPVSTHLLPQQPAENNFYTQPLAPLVGSRDLFYPTPDGHCSNCLGKTLHHLQNREAFVSNLFCKKCKCMSTLPVQGICANCDALVLPQLYDSCRVCHAEVVRPMQVRCPKCQTVGTISKQAACPQCLNAVLPYTCQGEATPQTLRFANTFPSYITPEGQCMNCCASVRMGGSVRFRVSAMDPNCKRCSVCGGQLVGGVLGPCSECCCWCWSQRVSCLACNSEFRLTRFKGKQLELCPLVTTNVNAE